MTKSAEIKPKDFYIGSKWLIQPSLDRISDPVQDIQIPPKYMHVLVYLAEHAGRLVRREDLLDTIWKNTIVVEESLTRAISELRKLLGDDPKKPEIIETIPKKGYRLIAAVTWKELTDHDSTPVNGFEQPLSYSDLNGKIARNENLIKSSSFRMHWKKLAIVLAIPVLGYIIWRGFFMTIQPASSAIRLMPLTSYPGDENHPVLSPDGNRVAFNWDDESWFNSSIYVKVIGSEDPLQLTTDGYVSEPAWSPDGRYISYVRWAGRGREIYVVPSLGGPERRLVEDGFGARDPVWSPDGKWIAYSKFVEAEVAYFLYIVHMETQEIKQVTSSQEGPVYDRKPIFSPDGNRLAFIRTYFGKQDIYWVSMENDQIERVTNTDQWITDVDWAPDGESIIYSSREGIWKVPISGGQPVLLAAGGLKIDNISVARNNWRLAYEQGNREENIWQISVADTTEEGQLPKKFIGSSRIDTDLNISPNGRMLTFVSDRSGHPQVWISLSDGSDPVQLTNFNGFNVYDPIWSPNSKQIAFTAQMWGHSDTFIIDAAGGKPMQLTKSNTREISPSWSRDGKWIYFSSNRTGAMEIWKMPINGDKTVKVTENGGVRAAESFDRKWLYIQKRKNGQHSLWKRPIQGGPEVELFTLPDGYIAGWKLCKKGIYFGHQNNEDNLKINLFDYATSQIQPIVQTQKRGFNLTVSPNCRWFFFTQVDRAESDIVLLDNFR